MSDVPIDLSDASRPAGLKPSRWQRRLAAMLLSRIRVGRLTLITPGSWRISHGREDGPQGELRLRRWRLLWRLLTGGDIGFARSYIDGDWDSPDLPALIELAGRNLPTLHRTMETNPVRRFANRMLHRLNANTKRGSRRNISRHYDLGNDFYALWLDPGLSYSSGLYSDPGQTLDSAQAAKQQRVLELLALRGSDTVLEIGIGWGALARLLVAAGCRLTGVTLSAEQLAHAARHLGSAADLRLQDYRDVTGRFDRIVCIEMIEAVGEAYWPSFFSMLRDRLQPNGRIVLQAITIREDLFEGYRRCTDFIQHSIFPGGMLPTQAEIRRQAERAGLALLSADLFGASYARTLAEWRRRFHAAWPEIECQGFDRRFFRMWDYYLGYCEGGFRAGTIDVGHYVLAPISPPLA